MSMPLIKRNMKQMLKPLLIFIAVLAMYQGVIIYLYDPELIDMLNDYQKMMPELMSAVGMTGGSSNLLEFINTYLYGFLMQMFPFIFTLIMGNNYVMKYIDTGSMSCLLATPNSRVKIIVTQAISLILSVTILMCLLTGLGIVFAEGMFPGELDISGFLSLNASALLLQLMIASIVFAAACVFNESKNFYTVGCGLPLLFFLFSMIGNMGDKLEKFKYISLYTLFPADKIVVGESGVWEYNLIMAAVAIVLFVGGSVYFTRKDLSI